VCVCEPLGCSTGVVRGVPGLNLPSWVVRVLHLLVAILLGACLALVGLYGSMFSSTVVLMWLVSALSAFLTSALLLEPFTVSYKSVLHSEKLKDVHFYQNITFAFNQNILTLFMTSGVFSADMYSGTISGCCGETSRPRGGGAFGSGDRGQKDRRASGG